MKSQPIQPDLVSDSVRLLSQSHLPDAELVHLQDRFWAMNGSAAYALAERSCGVFRQCS
jgi:hypothetical protein